MGLYQTKQWEEFIKHYVQQISLVLKKEKTKNKITGRLEDPDLTLINEFEQIVGAPSDESEKEGFRQNIISQIGVWSLDHPKEPVVYAKVFLEFWRKLERHYADSQKGQLSIMHNALLTYDTDQDDPSSDGGKLVRQTLKKMKSEMGYCDHCAKEVIVFLMRQRY
jgi:predicted Ser/Thr protein kinase